MSVERPAGGWLADRVVAITGAGRGIGRAHALFFASEGARVVVNDLGTEADEVVAEIAAAGGRAVAVQGDVATWDGGRAVVDGAVAAFGRLDALVNNAGFLHDRALVHMDEHEWDEVVAVHLKGHFVPTRWAAAHWRERHRAGEPVRAALLHTSSTSGLIGNPGQSNYGTAKAGVAAFSMICAQELGRYGVRSNCLVPSARTRLTDSAPGLSDVVAPPREGFDPWDPANVSPVAAYLASEACTITGRTYFVQGGVVRALQPWSMGPSIEEPGRWTVAGLAQHLAEI
ncbi:MAG: SDR family NAD(P)-dependent oxidoreductase [Acidimicrobiia bacterium]